MRNKILAIKRLETLDGAMKRMRNALNERNLEAAHRILQELLELRGDLQDIIEREN